MKQETAMKTVFFDQTGPMMRYDGVFLRIQDLNPETDVRWRMSRWEMLVLGLRAIWAAIG